jgi:hypothetical protein
LVQMAACRRDEPIDAGLPIARERCYWGVGRHRKAAAPCIVLQESNKFIVRVKSLRVRSLVTVTRHHRLKLRCVQMKGVPALGEPGLADPPALQHAVREASFGQHIACATVWKVQSKRPVTTSKPRTSPGGGGRFSHQSKTDEPTTMMSRTITGGEVMV